MKITKSLLVKLGGECNLGCTHCHCENNYYEFNPDIIPWIKSQDFTRIVYGGGEPLLYWDLICGISNQLGRDYDHYFVTNGTLLTPEIVNYLNSNDNMSISISYDGENGNRDDSIPVNWDLVGTLERFGICSCYYPRNSIHKINEDLLNLEQAHFKSYRRFENFMCAFPHQTSYAPNNEVTIDDVYFYIKHYKEKLALAIAQFKYGLSIENNHVLKQALKNWYLPKHYSYGCQCFNDYKQHITIDGRFLLCPYGHEYIGDIYSGVDTEKIKQYLPDSCKSCEYWNICRNSCIANITEHECIIFKEMHTFLKGCFQKLNIEQDIIDACENAKQPIL